ncbi:MAG: endonuclease/exonuclease/phosphatase family metal-dependent hydrolase [Chlamydiales bacterium]|jgi:endonuclease/exonuclease/phosphatase family metal-dependent hydrolase
MMMHPDPPTVKILTYNLHKGRSALRRDVLAEIADALAERAPDLLTCQEVFHGTRDTRHQCEVLAEALDHAHVFGPNAFYRKGCHGNATFARLPVAEHVNIDVTQSTLEKRGILHATLQDGPGTIETMNVHFSLTRRQRARQWRRLLETLPEDLAVPTIVCGDFNDWSGSLDRVARRSGTFHNALWNLPTPARQSYPAQRPLLALDRIYLRGFRVVSAEVLRGQPWSRLSDHLPIEVVVERTP